MASEWSGAAVRAYIAADATTLASHAFILNSRRIEEAALDCQQAFSSPHFLHAFAVKANPLSCVLDLVVRSGTALETASIAEFEAARKALERTKFDTSRIVFGSPAKTLQELRIAVYSRCFLNVDNFQELERVVVGGLSVNFKSDEIQQRFKRKFLRCLTAPVRSSKNLEGA